MEQYHHCTLTIIDNAHANATRDCTEITFSAQKSFINGYYDSFITYSVRVLEGDCSLDQSAYPFRVSTYHPLSSQARYFFPLGWILLYLLPLFCQPLPLSSVMDPSCSHQFRLFLSNRV
mmetsp:Transcript_21361/g.29930  ORF Transcript_21361/g.29930 Transcript_21361/m.29930 type:complete len:119 (-) Transcript_21361:172-528(-)